MVVLDADFYLGIEVFTPYLDWGGGIDRHLGVFFQVIAWSSRYSEDVFVGHVRLRDSQLSGRVDAESAALRGDDCLLGGSLDLDGNQVKNQVGSLLGVGEYNTLGSIMGTRFGLGYN